jgi:hypothetical protein
MNVFRTAFSRAIRAVRARLCALPLCAGLVALAACNGTAVVTLTSTAAQDNFLAYRVGLVSVQLVSSGGKSGLTILPASTMVDFATLTDVSEVLGAAAVAKGRYTSALITLDYSVAQIVYDDGSLNGVALTPVGANGKALGRIQLNVTLDPGSPFSISSKGASQLALDFKLAASDVVDLAHKTVTVTPLIGASALPIDTKPVRIRGPLAAVGGAAANAATGSFTMGITPFNGNIAGAGRLSIITSDTTTYEVNGNASTGSAGLAQLAGSTGTLCVAYGTLVAGTTTTTTIGATGTGTDTTGAGTTDTGTTGTGATGAGTTDTGTTGTGATGTGTTGTGTTGTGTTNTPAAVGLSSTATVSNTVTFSAAQVLAGGSVQGAGLDRVSGIVSGRSGNTLSIEDGTLVSAAGGETFIAGTTTVNMGPNTVVTVFGQGGSEISSTLAVSVGSTIDAFGVAASLSSGNAILDASAGRVRIDTTSASGMVSAQGSGTLNLNLKFLGGRAAGVFDFVGSGAAANPYVVNTGTLDLTNATAGAPVIVAGSPSSFGAAPPNFTAVTLLDPTTIQAELVVDWGAGTTAPFTTYDSSAIDLDVHNTSIGARHQVTVGSQTIDIVGLSADPSIAPNPTASNMLFAIGHAKSSKIENFDTYAAFVTQLQTELNGTTPVLGMTALGQYTVATFSFGATSITLLLND